MKKYTLIVCLMIMAALIAGCASGGTPSETVGSGSVSSPSSSSTADNGVTADLISQIDALYAQLDRSKLPLQDYSPWLSLDAETLAELPPQLVVDTEDAYRYAQIIGNFFFFGGNILTDFDDADMLFMPTVIRTALYHTTPIQWRWESFDGPYDDHILTQLLKNEYEEERHLSDLYYVEDLHETIRMMFGEGIDFYDFSVEPYVYYAREGVYGRVGDFGGPYWVYPMITSMTETEDGMICEVVPVLALDRETPMESLTSFEELTAQNFGTATAGDAKYRYTFRNTSGDYPILTSLVTLRAETA